MSGRNTDISAGHSVTVAAAKALSLFAQGGGMQLCATKGKVEIQAQSDLLTIDAMQDITIKSSKGKVAIDARQELLLTCGGAFIKLSGGNIEIGCPGNILLKAVNVQKMGPENIDVPEKEFPLGYNEGFTIKDPESGKIKPYTKYRITTSEGDVIEGVSDDEGKTLAVNTSKPSAINIEFPKTRSSDSKDAQS